MGSRPGSIRSSVGKVRSILSDIQQRRISDIGGPWPLFVASPYVSQTVRRFVSLQEVKSVAFIAQIDTMPFNSFFGALLFASITLPSFSLQAPGPREPPNILEGIPWEIRALTVYKPVDKSQQEASLIFFTFQDFNTGLELDINCVYKMPNGEEPAEPNDFASCGQGSPVDFRLTGDKLEVRRRFKDPR